MKTDIGPFFLIVENSCLKSRGYFLFLLGFFDSYRFWNKEKQTFGTFIYRFLFSIYYNRIKEYFLVFHKKRDPNFFLFLD
jgi:hypothetical protein